MGATPHERAVEIENSVRPQDASGASEEPERRLPRRDVDHVERHHRGKRRVVLHAPNCLPCIDCDRRADIGEPFGGNPRRDAGAEAGSGSLGCQRRPGSALAKQMTCSPVPDPISSAMPLFGRIFSSTSRIGPLLRAAEGEKCRPSPVRSRFSSATGFGGVSDFAMKWWAVLDSNQWH